MSAERETPSIVPVNYPCGLCGYNLRGLPLEGPDGAPGCCPECGAEMPPWSVMVGDEGDELERTAAYLRTHDIECRRCRVSLRGREDGSCPKCGRVYRVVTLTGGWAAPPGERPPLPGWLNILVVAVVILGIPFVALLLWFILAMVI